MRRKNKSIYILFVIVVVLCISVGYAVLNSTLVINGKSNISKNTWNLHFDNIKVKDGSVDAVKIPNILNNTTVDFEVNLKLPGDYYEFTVDVVNNGTIDAMIDSVVKTPDLTEEQKKYINYIVEYQNGEQITAKQIIRFKEYVRIKVKVEYKKDITTTDLLQNTETLNLGFSLYYLQSDYSVVNDVPTANGSLDEIGTIVTIGTERFYTIGSEGENVKLLSMYNLHVGNEITALSVDDDGNETFMMNALSNPTGMQSSKAKGAMAEIDGENINYLFPWVGVTAFSNDEQHGEQYSYYEGSIVEGYVNNYKELLEKKYDIEIEEARLIHENDLSNNEFNCNDDVYNCVADRFYWIYSTSYWTGVSIGTNILICILSVGDGTYLPSSSSEFLGVRPVIVMKKSDIVVDSKPFAYGDINEIGTIVKLGTERFYTIGIEGENVKLLSMYNLYVGNEVDEDWNVTLLENQIGMQSSKAKGFFSEFNYETQEYEDKFPFIGVTEFSNEDKHGTNYSDYKGSIVEGYVNNYKESLESKFDVEIEEARLITKEELIDEDTFNCSEEEYFCLNSPYPWIYSSSYWVGSAYDSSNLWFVDSLSGFDFVEYNYNTEFGVRPVIEISKDYFE